MVSNFDFLKEYWEDLAEIGVNAEGYVYSDPNAAIIKIGMIAEKIVSYIFSYEQMEKPAENTQVNLINVLKREGLIPETIDNILYTIRRARNEAVHNNQGNLEQAKTIMKLGFNLCCWFMELYGDWQFEAPVYFEPLQEFGDENEIKARLEEQDKKIEELLKKVELAQTKASRIDVEEKGKQAKEIAENLELSAQEQTLINKDAIRLEVNALPAISYSLQQNGYEPINSIEITNKETTVEQVSLHIKANPEVFSEYSRQVEVLPSGETISIRNVKLKIDVNYLISLTERQKTIVTAELLDKDGNVLCEEIIDIDVLAYDQWTGATIYPELLSSFVTPNHPQIFGVISKASEYLKQWTGNSAFDGYQSDDKSRVVMQGAAIYTALQALDITYVETPASFEYIGQRVRLCDTVLNNKIGNCLDLTLLYASCLEAVGINPILCIKPGHIFPGFWLTKGCFPDAANDDASIVTKRMAEGIDDITVVEATAFTYGKNIKFDDAVDLAFDEMTDSNPVDLVIDVKCSRLLKIIPLPSRVMTSSGFVVEREKTETYKIDRPVEIKDYGYDFNTKQEFNKKLQWERKLLDLGLRNSLINLHLSKSIIPILTSSVDELEDALYDGDSFIIHPKPENWKNSEYRDDFASISNLGEFYEFVSEEFKAGRVHSSLTENELNTSLKNLYRNARTSFEENGANTLFIAVGLLKWCEPKKSSTPHYAPIILLPVEITKKSAAQAYTISLRRDDEPQVNITILEKLKQDLQMNISGLDILPEDEHGLDIRKILTVFRNAILNQPYWDVLESSYLGIFSFSQFVMWNDIHNRSEDLEKSKIVKSLIEGHLTWSSHDISPEEANNTRDSYLTMPVDGSQLYAIKEAEHGESFVLHGPPGTGKSQTITSMIADLLAKNRKVLFVAEKRAALEVVQKRITELGLDPFCLELHSNKARKKDVLEKIEKVFEVSSRKPAGYEARITQIEEIKKDLDVYVQELHQQRACGASLYETLNKYEAYSKYNGYIDVAFDSIDQFTDIELDNQTYLIDELIIIAKTIGHPNTHPLKGVGISEYYQGIEEEITTKTNQYLQVLFQYVELVESISETLGIKLGDDFDSYTNTYVLTKKLKQLDEYPAVLTSGVYQQFEFDNLALLCDKYITCEDKKQALLKSWDKTFLSKDAQELVSEYSRIQSSNALSRAINLNKFIKGLTVYSKGSVNKENIRFDLQNLLDYQINLKEANEMLQLYRPSLGNLYRLDNTNWNEVRDKLVNLKQLIQKLDNSCGMAVRKAYVESEKCKKDIVKLQSVVTEFDVGRKALFDLIKPSFDNIGKWYESEDKLFSKLLENIGLLKDWTNWNRMCESIESNKLQPVVDAYYAGTSHDDIKGLYIKSFYKKLATLIIDECTSLVSFNGELFERKVEQFRVYDNQMRELTKKQVYYLVSNRISTYIKEHEQDPALASLRRLIRSKGRGVSIRKLFENSSEVIQSLCPCILMSPISAAQYLDPSTKKFDVVIFDEASQLQTCKAVGVIARAENAIIVGDPKQMPPTNFFMTNTVDEENIEQEDLESILDDGLGINMPQSYLNWHYRSNHESLIAFSNSQFYDNKLFTFPSLNDRESKVKLVKIDGVFERGKRRTNQAEAQAIVEEIKHRFEDSKLNKDSIGVVTFNIYQQNLIDDLLTAACAKNKKLDQWVNNSEEPLFIKNLESVQGDERDVIMFSVTYGKDENGKVSMNFGPLNRDGGWRRLNVAVSRARKEMIVFSSLMPEQINTARTRAEGVSALKNFLIFASNNKLTLNNDEISGIKNEKNQVIESITRELVKRGYSCDTLVGHSNFKIDVCVVDPEDNSKYIVGVLLDGDTYASSNYTRDREISQTTILSNLGWRTVRIWSMDWWNNKDKQISKILDAINKQKEENKKEKTVEVEMQEQKSVENIAEIENEPQLPGMARPMYQLNDDGEIIGEYESLSAAIRATGINSKSIRDAASGVQKHAGGYKWAYKDEYIKPKKQKTPTTKDTNKESKGKENTLLGVLRDYGFEVIDNRETSDVIWVINENNNGNLFTQIMKAYNIVYKFEFRGAVATGGRKAWRIMGYKGD